MTSNIPEELKALQQWVCFDITGGQKIPYTPGSDSMAASNRPRDWRSFRAALKDVETGRRQHLGFCFTSGDPYVFIDLDDPEDNDQVAVFQRIKTYAQRSVSGEGCHLICRGNFEGPGKHPTTPEAGIFKENRFCLMTGDVVEGRSTINAVADADLQAIHSWLGGGTERSNDPLVEYESELPDQTVVDMGRDRFTKFHDLCCGRWQKFEEYNGDHSTADHAFIAMLCDLTESNEQVRYLFKISGMWTDERAEKKSAHGPDGYINRTIRKIRSSQARDAAIASRVTLCFGEDEPEPLPEKSEKPVALETPEVHGDRRMIDSIPKGLLRDIVHYSYASAFHPLQEASLAMGLSLLSGIAGRAYITSTATGLNLWTVLVGGTSCGKDEYQGGIGRVISALEKRGHKAIGGLFGGELASGQSLEAVFSTRKRYIAYAPEFGDMFKQIANPAAPDYIKNLQRALLNSYKTADKHGSLRARRKAQGVDGEETIERPCLVVAGEATPESLYGNMTTRELATGFLQRFLVINAPVTSWSLYENPNHAKAPPKSLLDRLERLIAICDGLEVPNRKGKSYIEIEESPEAADHLARYRFDKRRENMVCPDGLARKELINRAGLKALRVAGILALSSDFDTPRIELEHAQWATAFVDAMDADLLEKFTSGEVGSGQPKQEAEIMKAIRTVMKMPVPQRRKLGMVKKVAVEPVLLPMSVVKDMVINNAAFAADKSGAVTSFERSIESLIKAGALTKVEKNLADDSFGHTKGVLLCVS